MDLEQKLSKYFSKDWSREQPEVGAVGPARHWVGVPCSPQATLCQGHHRWHPLPLSPGRPEGSQRAGSQRAGSRLLRPELSVEWGETCSR